MTVLEIERKFLIAALPENLDFNKSQAIAQGYIALTPDSREVRVRRKGGACYLAVKVGRGLSREETEIEIDETQFSALWATTAHARLEKIRHHCPYAGHLIEIDQYQGPLAPLLTAEVEFHSEQESRDFLPPAWFGTEVTDDLGYSNYNLATRGLPA